MKLRKFNPIEEVLKFLNIEKGEIYEIQQSSKDEKKTDLNL